MVNATDSYEAAIRDGFLIWRPSRRRRPIDPYKDTYYNYCVRESRPYVTVRLAVKYAVVEFDMDTCSMWGQVHLNEEEAESFRLQWRAMPGVLMGARSVTSTGGGCYCGVPIGLARAFAGEIFLIATLRTAAIRKGMTRRDEYMLAD